MLKCKWLNLASFFSKDQPSYSSARPVTKSRRRKFVNYPASTKSDHPHRNRTRQHFPVEEHRGSKRQSYALSTVVPSDLGGQQDKASLRFLFKPIQEHQTNAIASGVFWELCSICSKYPGPVAWLVSEDTYWGDSEYNWYLPLEEVIRNQSCVFCTLICDLIPHDLPVQHLIALNTEVGFSPREITEEQGKPQSIFRTTVISLSIDDKDSEEEHPYYGGWCESIGAIGLVDTHHPLCILQDETAAIYETGPDVKMNIQRVSSWIRDCEMNHDHELSPAFQHLRVLNIYLIDVTNNQLVQGTTSRRYIALSYVWGSVSGLQTTRKNVAAFMAPRGLLRYKSQIPKAVRDAMKLVRKLQERYLWVDTLCIEQNNQEHKELHISNMDAIYHLAHLVVIAHSGENAESALPGLSRGTRIKGAKGRLLGDDIAHLKPFSRFATGTQLETIKPSPYERLGRYETRGWTFQEEILARRALLFNNYNVSFRCDEGVHHDQIGCSIRMWDTSSNDFRAFLYEQTQNLDPANLRAAAYRFGKLVEGYTQRTLTYSSDKLNAIGGILRVFNNSLGGEVFYGIPESLITYGVLFEALSSARDARFPSWSWAGWHGTSWYDILFHVLNDSESTLILEIKHLQRKFDPARLPYSLLEFSTYRIDADKFEVGILNVLYLKGSTGQCGSISHREFDSNILSSRRCYFILWSRSHFRTIRELDRSECRGYPARLDAILQVLLVMQKGRYAERVCYAFIHEDAFKDADPVKTRIKLA